MDRKRRSFAFLVLALKPQNLFFRLNSVGHAIHISIKSVSAYQAAQYYSSCSLRDGIVWQFYIASSSIYDYIHWSLDNFARFISYRLHQCLFYFLPVVVPSFKPRISNSHHIDYLVWLVTICWWCDWNVKRVWHSTGIAIRVKTASFDSRMSRQPNSMTSIVG